MTGDSSDDAHRIGFCQHFLFFVKCSAVRFQRPQNTHTAHGTTTCLPHRIRISLKSVFLWKSPSTRIASSFVIGVSEKELHVILHIFWTYCQRTKSSLYERAQTRKKSSHSASNRAHLRSCLKCREPSCHTQRKYSPVIRCLRPQVKSQSCYSQFVRSN